MKICDSHSDILTHSDIASAVRHLKSLYTKKIKTLSCAVFTSELENPINYITRANEELKKISSKADKFILSVEDCSFITPKNLQNLIALHPVSCGLTWNFDNSLAGGAHKQGSVTPFGAEVIKAFEKNNIIIDTAHLNRKSFYQVCKLSKKPIYNSHCAVNKLCPHPRNLTDRQIKHIFDTNGFMGICLVSYFLTKNQCSAKTVALHFDYVIRNFGYKNVGFGTDFFGTKELPFCVSDYKGLQLVLRELKKMGHSHKIIKHIAHKNYTNFLKRCRVF